MTLDPAILVAIGLGTMVLFVGLIISEGVSRRRTAARFSPKSASGSWFRPGGLVDACFVSSSVKKYRSAKMRKEVEATLDEVVLELAEGLKAGENLCQAINRLAKSMSGPWGRLLGEVVERQSGGMALIDAVRSLERTGSRSVELLVRAIEVQMWSGGNLSEILLRLVETIRRDRSMEGQIKAKTAESRWTAYLLAGLPVIMVFIMGRIQPSSFETLYSEPVGRIGLLYAVLSWAVGLFFLTRILRFD